MAMPKTSRIRFVASTPYAGRTAGVGNSEVEIGTTAGVGASPMIARASPYHVVCPDALR